LEVCQFENEGGLKIEETLSLMKIMEADLYDDVQKNIEVLNV